MHKADATTAPRHISHMLRSKTNMPRGRKRIAPPAQSTALTAQSIMASGGQVVPPPTRGGESTMVYSRNKLSGEGDLGLQFDPTLSPLVKSHGDKPNKPGRPYLPVIADDGREFRFLLPTNSYTPGEAPDVAGVRFIIRAETVHTATPTVQGPAAPGSNPVDAYVAAGDRMGLVAFYAQSHGIKKAEALMTTAFRLAGK